MSLTTYNPSIPEEQSIIVDRLRESILSQLPDCEERTAYGVPHFYLRSRVCFVWPTACPGSGVLEDGVLLGFWKGHLIKHKAASFSGQSNRVVRFVVYDEVDQINDSDVIEWLTEARALDKMKILSRQHKSN